MFEYKNIEHGETEYLNYNNFEKVNFYYSDYKMIKQELGNIN